MNGRYGSEIRSDLTTFCADMCSLSLLLFEIDMNSSIQLSFLLQSIEFSLSFLRSHFVHVAEKE